MTYSALVAAIYKELAFMDILQFREQNCRKPKNTYIQSFLQLETLTGYQQTDAEDYRLI